ncbi:MAG: hypothetical protein VYA86_04660 [Candidatus Thermoplasmatota archaeon]|nr:hypothetical protein [Candidatus Thermoplasmatota archaeon]
MTRNSSVSKSLFLVILFLTSLFAAGLTSQPQSVLLIEEVDSTSGGARHLYTFADGSSEAIAIYQSGTPAKNVKVAMPIGAEVTGAELTISGASATGWNSITDTSRSDWGEGDTDFIDNQGDSVTLSMEGSETWFDPHDTGTSPDSTSAWYDNTSYAIRQPHTTNVSETRFSSQISLPSGTLATYNGAAFAYRDMIFASTWDSNVVKNTVKVLFPNNGTQMTTGPNNQPLRPDLDIGTCTIPNLGSSWQAYGWRDWAVTDDERVFGIISSYRGQNAVQYNRIVEWDIQHPLAWKCISSYDVSSGGYGDFTAISYDRTRDSVWVNHGVRKSVIQYEFDGAGSFERNSTDYYTYFMSSGQVRGMSVHGDMFWFRTYQSWSSDNLECFAITGDPGSVLTKQTGTASIPANGYGLHYDGQRLNTLDHYSWTQGQRYREFGSGISYLITAQPGTSTWVSETLDVEDDIVAANMEVSWSTSAAGDRVEYWISADGGTHWVTVTNNETVHFDYPGNELKWKVQLVGTTAVSWWVSIDYTSEYASAGEWTSPILQTGTQVGKMRATWASVTPQGTAASVLVSNDNGQNWVFAENDVEIDWGTNVGNQLIYKIALNTSDSSITPSVDELTLHYEEGYPSAVRIDIGDDGQDEYTGSGGLQDPIVVSGQSLVDALNAEIPQNGEGTVNITFTIKAGSPGRIRISDLDITYRYQTRVIGATLDGGMLVPDGVDRILVTQVAIGDDATMLQRVDVMLGSTLDDDPTLRWTAGDTCSEVSDPANIVRFDFGNCTSVVNAGDIVSIRMPIQSEWEWNDESSTEVNISVVDDLGLSVNSYQTEDLNLRVENDIQLLDMKAFDESGRELLAYDWMRGGTNLTFTGSIAFEGTTLSPQAGQFNLELIGENLTQDGQGMGDPQTFILEANPAYGQYYMTFLTPLQSSQGGMLFQISANSLPNGSTFINPNFNTMRIVLDGNSPLVMGATPDDGIEVHAGTQSISVVIEDSVDPPVEITLHYWVESQDDLNYNLLPDANEYRTSLLRSPENLPGGINIFSGIIDDSSNEHGEKVSFYVSGQDQQNNALARGGGPVCPDVPTPCGISSTITPNWDADLVTYWIREEFSPVIESDNSTILGHDDKSPLHPGTEYVARLLIGDGNGWQDIQSVHLSLIEDFNDERASIWANFTPTESGHEMHLESGSTAVAVSNLYSSYSSEPTNSSILYLDIRFQLTWWFPEEFDTNGESRLVPIVKVIDWPCDLNTDVPCHEDSGGLAYDEWSLDNDLRFDMVPGHFTATDLATGRNLYRPGEDPELIAAGQVVRIGGRVLFSEDSTPAPEGAFDIVVGDLERSWSAVPREGGDFTLDILVPNVRSGGLDMYASLENLPGLADDTTNQQPRIQLVVDGTPPEIRSIGPSGDVPLSDTNELPVSLHVSDEHGFDSNHPAEIHWRIRAGTSEISRGNQPFQQGTPIGADWSWEGIMDLTDSGSIELLPGYMVDVWVTGSDEAGNPYLAENNTENSPLTQWRLIRVGPDINLRGEQTEISWDNPSPVGGDVARLSIQGVNENDQSGEITFILLEEISADRWVEVSDAETIVMLEPMANWTTTLELQTQEVDESQIHRYQLIARDRHIDIDWVTIEPIEVKPHTARDGEALSQQIDESRGLFVLYIIAVASLCFGVSMLVLYRREKQAGLDDEMDSLDHSEEASESLNNIPPPAGFEDVVATNPLPPPGFENVPPPANTLAPPGFENVPPANIQNPAEVNVPLNFNDSVFLHIVSTHGIHDGAAFLSFATHFDADGNGYLKQSELNNAASEYVSAGHNQPATNNAFTDEQLLAAGWSQEQIDVARSTGQI